MQGEINITSFSPFPLLSFTVSLPPTSPTSLFAFKSLVVINKLISIVNLWSENIVALPNWLNLRSSLNRLLGDTLWGENVKDPLCSPSWSSASLWWTKEEQKRLVRPTLKLRQEQALENTVLGFPAGRSVKSLCEAVFLCRSRDLYGQSDLAKVNWFSLPHSWLWDPYHCLENSSNLSW